MQAISIIYNGTPHWRVAQILKKTLFSFRRPSGRKEYNDGVVSLHEFLLFSSNQSDGFTWASKIRMSQHSSSNPRTTERRLRKLIDSGLIKPGIEWINGKLRKGHYILAHEDIVEALRAEGISYRLHNIEAKKSPNRETPATVSAAAPAPSASPKTRQVVRQVVEGGIYKDRTPERTFSPPYPPAGGASPVEEEAHPERRAEQAGPQGPAPIAAPVSEPEPPKQAPACAGFTEPPPPSIPESSPKPIAVAEGQTQSPACATPETTVVQPQPESPAWQAALEVLRQSIDEHEIELWLKPIHVTENEGHLQLDCEDEGYKAWVIDKFGEKIVRALNETGFNGTLSYSVGQHKKVVEDVVQEQERVRRNKAFATKMNELAQKDWKEQFKEFVRVYPQKGLPAGLGRVEKLFGRLHRRGHLPSIDVLFRILFTLKRSHQWNKDGGKYVIGIEKFLRNAPWNDYELWSRSFV